MNEIDQIVRNINIIPPQAIIPFENSKRRRRVRERYSNIQYTRTITFIRIYIYNIYNTLLENLAIFHRPIDDYNYMITAILANIYIYAVQFLIIVTLVKLCNKCNWF